MRLRTAYCPVVLYFIMYIVLPSHLFYRILFSPLSTLLPLMFVISCVCQLINKECMMMMMYSIDIGSVSVFTVQHDDTSDETEVSPNASVWLIVCASLVCIRAVERGCINLSFFLQKN